MMRDTYRQWLIELTQLPTAAGCEQRVVDWVYAWARKRRGVKVRADRYGNLMLMREGKRSKRPVVFTAHMDHPAFVVSKVEDGGLRLEAEFRGGVHDSYFTGTAVRWHGEGASQRGVVRALDSEAKRFKLASIEMARRCEAKPGDVVTWDLGKTAAKGDRLRAPACDDLAGVAGALAGFEEVGRGGAKGVDVRVLLTRAEEIGFIGAMAACGSGIMPQGSRLVALENSKSFAESPIGGGPIVRVGDKTSTFDPALTYRVCQVAAELEEEDDSFRWQRKLMPGGTCEATAYQEFGYTATCVCLPLGNYHNMNEGTGRIDREMISLRDFDGLVRLLAATARRMDDVEGLPTLKVKLEELLAQRGYVIGRWC